MRDYNNTLIIVASDWRNRIRSAIKSLGPAANIEEALLLTAADALIVLWDGGTVQIGDREFCLEEVLR